MTEAFTEDEEHPKRNANENPWYLLATLYGEPTYGDVDLQSKNRRAWNRYIADMLSAEDMAKLMKEDRHPTEDLFSLSDDEKRAVKEQFEKRCIGLSIAVDLPDLHQVSMEFSNFYFSNNLNFRNFIFPIPINFSNATFSGDARFDGATFSGNVTFDGATFSRFAGFKGATFSRVTGFGDAIFSRNARFDGATFSRFAEFNGATFSGFAEFDGAIFSRNARFDGAIFSGVARFDDVIFSRNARFNGAIFFGVARFVNAEMKAETSFKAARFVKVPLFFGAKLHEGTNWYGVKWPDPPTDTDAAEQFVRAYERLKLEMDRLKKHEDELDFFVREMQSRRVLQGRWKGLPIALYGLLSRYGRSYAHPLYGILVTTLIGALPFWLYFGLFKFKKAFGLSLANTLGVFGFRKDFISLGLIEALPNSLKLIAAMQTLIGGVLIFLFGLALRNIFRMK